MTGQPGSAAILEQLQRANLFLVPFDEDGQWYRYHALFAEAMQHEARRRLGQDALDACAVSASAWYEQQGMFAEAVEAALEARAFDRAAALLEHTIRPQHYQELIEYHTLRRWLSSLPEAILARFPTLCLRLAMVVLFSADGRSLASQEQMERALTLAEQFWQAQDSRSGMGIVRAARALIAGELGDLALAARLASAALPDLPEQEHNWHGACLRLLGTENLADGAVHEASQTLVAARAQFDAAGNSHGARATLLKLGDAYAMQGALHQAAEVYRAVSTLSSMDLLDRGNALLGLAGLSYEWNALDAAEQEARTAYELGERIADELLQVRAGLALARIQHARGDTSQAQQLLFALLTYARQPLLVWAVEAAQARLALAIGDLPHAQRWYAAFAQQRPHIPHTQCERVALTSARLLIAQGEAGAALQLLDDWRAEAHAAGRIRCSI
jgi:LuxR family maltose regulon positive regulatory protein